MVKVLTRYIITSLFIVIIISCSDSIIESTPSIDEEQKVIVLAPKFSEIQSNIFNQSCAFSGCHVSNSVAPDLSESSYSNIVNKLSSTGESYIKPNSPNESYLLQKILGSNGINGSRMPINSSALSQEKIDALTNWINDGAQNN